MISEYHVKRFCAEEPSKIENYEAAIKDENEVWDLHHRLEIQGVFRNSRKILKKCGMYYGRPASELIYLRHSEHVSLHQLGMPKSDETRSRMSRSKMGAMNPNFGKPLSEKARKCLSECRKGQLWWNDGKRNVRSRECPEGFVPGRLLRKSAQKTGERKNGI